MGVYQSKLEEKPETPHFEKYADLYSLDEDPRSPGVSRTPILVENKFASSQTQCSTFDDNGLNSNNENAGFCIPEPISPCLRYKMDNKAFEDSPQSSTTEKINTKTSNSINSQGSHLSTNNENCSKRPVRYRESNNMLKQALFKNYTDIDTTKNLLKDKKQKLEGETERNPLSCKTNTIFQNENCTSN